MNSAESSVGHQHDEIARPMLADDDVDDLIDRRRTARADSAAAQQVVDQAAESTAAPAPAASTGRPARRRPRPRQSNARAEVVLEHAPARRGRARLEHRPDARLRVRGTQRRSASRRPPLDGARSRHSTVTPSAMPTTSSRRFTPANDRSPSAIRSTLTPTSVATAIAAVALRTLCDPAPAVRNDPKRLTAPPEAKPA